MRSSLSSHFASLDDYVQSTFKRIEDQDPTLTCLLIDDFHYPEVAFDEDDQQYFDSQTIAKLLSKAKESTHIKDLELRFVDIDQTVTNALTDLFANGDASSDDSSSSSSSSKRQWNSVSIVGCTNLTKKASLDIISLIVNRCKKLLLNHNSIHNEGFYKLGMSLRSNHMMMTTTTTTTTTTLKSLHLKRENLCGMNSQALFLDGIKSNSTTLEEVVLNFCRFDEQGVVALGKFLKGNASIKTLDLGACYLADTFVEHVLQSLVDHPTIETLVLTLNSCHERGSEAMAKLLQSKNCHLKFLNLSHQKSDSKKPILDPISNALQSNTSLQSLKLSRNQLSDGDVSSLVEALKANSTLLHCDLTNNCISTFGFKAIAHALPNMKGLQSLHLLNNRFESIDCLGVTMLSAVQSNKALIDLEIQRSLPYFSEIQFHVALNWGGRQMLANQTNTPLALWPQILERAQQKNKAGTDAYKHDIMFHLLQGPVLLNA